MARLTRPGRTIEAARRRGVEFFPYRGRLGVVGFDRLRAQSPKLARRIRKHAAELLAYLRGERRPTRKELAEHRAETAVEKQQPSPKADASQPNRPDAPPDASLPPGCSRLEDGSVFVPMRWPFYERLGGPFAGRRW